MKLFRQNLIVNFSLLCSLLFLLSACGGGGDGSSPTTQSGGGSSSSSLTGTVSVGLTDNDYGYNAIVMTINEVGIVARNTATMYYNTSTFSNLPAKINILDYPKESTFYLGDIEVPLPTDGSEVCFEQIRLVLDANPKTRKEVSTQPIPEEDLKRYANYIVTNDGDAYALKTPSAQQSGLKLQIRNDDDSDDDVYKDLNSEESFCLSENDNALSITLHLDPKAVIKKPMNSNNPYMFKPHGIRIIEGDFFTQDPVTFIDGLVAVPTLNSAGICEEFYPDSDIDGPIVKVSAYNSATDTWSQTASLTEGPIKRLEACELWCDNDQTCIDNCPLDDSETPEGLCYYTGGFKLLLPEVLGYDVTGKWMNYYNSVTVVPYNSALGLYNSVLLELTPD